MAAGSTDAVLPGMILNLSKKVTRGGALCCFLRARLSGCHCLRPPCLVLPSFARAHQPPAGPLQQGRVRLCCGNLVTAIMWSARWLRSHNQGPRRPLCALQVTWSDPLAGGADRAQAAARLECTMQVERLGGESSWLRGNRRGGGVMAGRSRQQPAASPRSLPKPRPCFFPPRPPLPCQNLADCLAQSFPQPLESDEGKAELDTFLVYNQRRKVGLAWCASVVCCQRGGVQHSASPQHDCGARHAGVRRCSRSRRCTLLPRASAALDPHAAS